MEASALRTTGMVHGTRLGPLRQIATDDRLVAAVRAGRRGAFEAIYDRYHRQILSFCRHMLGSREEAEDAVQNSFMAAYNDLRRSEKPIQLRPWLFTIARNHCLSVLRARREHASIEDIEPAVEGLASEVQRREDLRWMLRDLARLPDDQRAALLLSELGALSHEEIGGVVGCPREKVKALVFQARSALAAGRAARETPCAEIREQLATLRGGALRRTALKGHLRDCPGCREFQEEVKRQRQAMALLLPVIPTAGLKAGVMSGVAVKASAGGAAGTGAGAGAGLGAAGAGTGAGAGAGLGASGLSAALANLGGVKLLVAGAIAVGGIGGTVAAVEVADHPWSPQTPAAGEDGQRQGEPPSGVVPARGGGEHAPGKQAGGVANGKNAKGEHGRSGTAPGRAGTAPGRAGTSPGKSGAAPGKSGSRSGQRRNGSHGKSGSAPGHGGSRGRGGSGSGGDSGQRGSSGSAPGRTYSGSSGGSSGNAPSGSGGNSGSAPAATGQGTAGLEQALGRSVK